MKRTVELKNIPFYFDIKACCIISIAGLIVSTVNCKHTTYSNSNILTFSTCKQDYFVHLLALKDIDTVKSYSNMSSVLILISYSNSVQSVFILREPIHSDCHLRRKTPRISAEQLIHKINFTAVSVHLISFIMYAIYEEIQPSSLVNLYFML